MEQRRYLITGAQGFVGRYLTALILGSDRTAEVLGVGRSRRLDGYFTHSVSVGSLRVPAPLPEAIQSSLDRRFRYAQVSLLDTGRLRDLIKGFQPQCIFHLASALSSAQDRDLFRSNVAGTASLMDAVSEAQVQGTRVIVGSSGGVYGEIGSPPIAESAPCRPGDIYSATKLAAEHVTRIKAGHGGFAFINARIFNIVGPGQMESHVCGRFAAQLASPTSPSVAILKVGRLNTTRDFIDVRDVADALLLLSQSGRPGATYNVASGRETPIHFVLSELIRLSGWTGQVETADERQADIMRQFADISRLEQLGFAARYPISASLEDVLRYYQRLSLSKKTRAPGEASDARDFCRR